MPGSVFYLKSYLFGEIEIVRVYSLGGHVRRTKGMQVNSTNPSIPLANRQKSRLFLTSLSHELLAFHRRIMELCPERIWKRFFNGWLRKLTFSLINLPSYYDQYISRDQRHLRNANPLRSHLPTLPLRGEAISTYAKQKYTILPSNGPIALSRDDVMMMHYGIEMRTSQVARTCYDATTTFNYLVSN